jgi:hypothetical protein
MEGSILSTKASAEITAAKRDAKMTNSTTKIELPMLQSYNGVGESDMILESARTL